MKSREVEVQLSVSLGLLVLTLAYATRMLQYGNHAGRVPAIVAGIVGVALLVQMVGQVRGLRAGHRNAGSGVADEGPIATAGASSAKKQGLAPAGRADPEPDNYETLLTLHGSRRRRFLVIAGFCVAFYVGSVAAGFVITTALLVGGLLVLSHERLWVAAAWAVADGVAVYGLVVGLLRLDPWSGYLFTL